MLLVPDRWGNNSRLKTTVENQHVNNTEAHASRNTFLQSLLSVLFCHEIILFILVPQLLLNDL